MSGIDQQGNIILPSGDVYNPQMAVQDTLANLYGTSQGIPYIPMPQYEMSPEFGVNRFLIGDEAIPLVFDVNDPMYTPPYKPFKFKPGDFSKFKSESKDSSGGSGSPSTDSSIHHSGA